MAIDRIHDYIVPGKRAHLVGIGGVSMSPLAEVLQGEGLVITGSDVKESLAVEAGIRKLLYVSSFDHMLGKQSDFRPVELRGLMEECRRRFRGNERGIRLEVDVPAGLTVSGNEAALQTVFDNLVENGLRYAASYIRMELTGEEEGGYLLTVENDGAPIPQPTLNVLFQKFYKLSLIHI